ncbi:hypothetical protein SBBP2_1960011 [Burkholderiales bacterium]|nr:hypothetical protein SBBP2_1960011 [Burkholderiales bacterium]
MLKRWLVNRVAPRTRAVAIAADRIEVPGRSWGEVDQALAYRYCSGYGALRTASQAYRGRADDCRKRSLHKSCDSRSATV